MTATCARIRAQMPAWRRSQSARSKHPYFTWAVVLACIASPIFHPFGDTANRVASVAFVVLALYRLTLPAPVPAAIQWLALSFLVGAVPSAWTRNTDDLLRPITEAAFFLVAGSCAFDIPRQSTRMRYILLLSFLTLAQAIGVIARYQLSLTSPSRIAWNLTGLLSALAAVGSTVAFPSPAALLLCAASTFLAFASGSRNAVLCLGVGVLVTLLRGHRTLRKKIALGVALGAALICSLALIKPELVNEYVVPDRFKRSVTYDQTQRQDAWAYWLKMCIERPFGQGFDTVQTSYWEYWSHNGWLDLWAKGGLPCLLLFLAGQAAMARALLQRARVTLVGSLALGLFCYSLVRMTFEFFPIGTSYGVNGFLILYVFGAAVVEDQPANQCARSLRAGIPRQIGTPVGL
jgi:O-antigen ligase